MKLRFAWGWSLSCLLLAAAGGLADEKSADNGPTSPAATAVPAVGYRVPNFVLPDATGKQRALADFSEAKAVVVVFMGTSCPIGNAYVPDLLDLQRRYGPQGVQVLGVNSNPSDTAAEIGKHAKEFQIDFPVFVDRDQEAADLLGAQRTPEAFVLDSRRVIRYRGRIDDRVGYDFKRDKPRRADLEVALQEVLAGKQVSVSRTELEGCLITRRSSFKKGEITYAKQVSRILQNRCAECHHPGTAAPFSLLSYDDARDRSAMIKETVVQRRMPPWNADPRYGKFSNDLRLTKEEIDTLVAWIDNGAPLGDEKDLPPRKEFVEGWTIGKPDVVFKMPREYTVQAKGTVAYKYFVTPTNFKEDMWIQASEARPGNRSVVHHIIAFIREKGSRRRQGALAGFAPGEEPQVYPAGIGKRVPAGAEILWQVHYTPTGKVEKDRSEVGIIFCKEPPKRAAQGGGAFNFAFKIPPGATHHRVVSQARFNNDVELLSLMPHMHLRGKDFKYTARYPDGREEVLLSVPNYDFNWQHRYRFAEPVRLPKGTTLNCVAHFDNSIANPANPDPAKTVRWGDQTWEEMMIGWYAHVDALPDDKPRVATKPVEQLTKQAESVPAKPADAKPADAKPADAKPSDAKPDRKTDKSATGDKPAAKADTPVGRIVRRTYEFKAADKDMEYALYLPKGFDRSKSYPLIVALHGLYSNPRQILGYPGFTQRADQHGYILVAPMGYNTRGWYGSRGKGGGRRSDPKNLGELSEKDVLNVLALVRDEFPIDEQRIYLYGHSMGGGGGVHFASNHPEIWAAIAVVAPAVFRGGVGLERARNVPAIVVQGDKDALVSVRGTRRLVEKMKQLEIDHKYIEVKGGGHVFVAFKHFDEIFSFFAARKKQPSSAKP